MAKTGLRASQSLLHQVSVSDVDVIVMPEFMISLNPFFIRSQFRIRGIYDTAGGHIESQSLLHQVSVSDAIELEEILGAYVEVSIPSSSGLSFGYRSNFWFFKRIIISSQSLLHQVSVSDIELDGIIDEKYYGSQSLLHQVSVSDLMLCSNTDFRVWKSLNPFFIRSQFRI